MGFFSQNKIPQKLNICLITKKFPYPGRDSDETYLWPIARGMAKLGHDVVVLSWKNPRGRPEINSGNVKAYFLGEQSHSRSTPFAELVLNKFEELHSVHPFHIVHCLDDSALLIGKNRKAYGVVTTLDVSATQMSQIFSILGMAKETLGGLLTTGFALFYKFFTTFYGRDRKLLKTADGVFVATPLQSIMLERYYMYPELKTFIVPYGMDYIETELKEKSEELQKKLGITDSSHVVLTFTDMTEFEEVANLIRAFQKVVIKKPNSKLIIVGNGPLKNQIEFETLNLALGSKVIFTGSLPSDELTDYIVLSDIYVNLSSRTTGFEPSMLEAMAQKKVVIGSELSPISTIITDGVNGFLVRPAGIALLTDLMAALFSGEFKSREAEKTVFEIGEHAREKVLDLFDVDKMVEQMLSAFHKILLQTGRRLNYDQAADASTRNDINSAPPPG
ncbi:MAG: glycosyltransferase family 4 protein [Bdellovibrionales bacterium]|nr:glycosyltransferase family 4 protein [Bdellovibrionales bacterium]